MVPTRVQAVFLALAAVAACLAMTAAPAEATTSLRSRAYAACPVAAHRGDHTRYTENGLNAFRSAIADRANILEMDVQTTRDGRPMLMHDETVTRTTNGRGSLASLTYSQVRALRMNDGSRVPTLAAVLALAAPTRVGVFVEIKHIPEARWPAFHARLTAFGLDRVVVNAFRSADDRALPRFHAAYPDVPVAVTTDFPMSVDSIARFGAVMVDYLIITEDWLAEMNARGLPVYAWVMNSSTSWRRYTGRIDAVITDHPRGYVAFRDRLCSAGDPVPPPTT
jgi:glycerophosphoryl diester phosphodiesterase